MTTRELLGFLRGLTDLQTGVVAGDVVEVSPPYDPSGITALAGANLAWELLCLLAHYRGDRRDPRASNLSGAGARRTRPVAGQPYDPRSG